MVTWQRKYLRERDGDHCTICGKRQEELSQILEVEHVNGNPADNRDFNLRLACKSCNQKNRWKLYRERIRRQRPERTQTSEFVAKLKRMHDAKVARGKSGATLGGNGSGPANNVPPIIDLTKMNLDGSEAQRNNPKLELEKSQHGDHSTGGEGGNVSDAATGFNDGGIEGRYNDNAVNASAWPKEMRVSREKEPEYANWLWDQLLILDGGLRFQPKALTVHDAIFAGAQAVGISPNTTKRYLMKLVSFEGPFRIGEGPNGHQEIQLREDYIEWAKEVHG